MATNEPEPRLSAPDAPAAVDPAYAVAAVLLFARDPAALAGFYRDHLGLPLRRLAVAGLDPHYACDVGRVYVSIWPEDAEADAPGALRPGLALAVRDVPAAYARLVAAGATPVFAPRLTALGTVARLRDPEGHALELYAPPPPRGRP